MPVPAAELACAAVSLPVVSQFQAAAPRVLRAGHAPNNLFHAANEYVEPDAHFVDLIVAIHFDAPRQVAFALRDVLQPYASECSGRTTLD
jgi:hypothetical protein